MKYKKIGVLSSKVANELNLLEHKNKPILVYDDRIQHVIDRHLKDFGCKEKVIDSYNNLHKVINKPDYVFYNKKTNGLEFYKFIENVCVVVRLSVGKVLKVRSWYPPNVGKIKNRKKQAKILIVNKKSSIMLQLK